MHRQAKCISQTKCDIGQKIVFDGGDSTKVQGRCVSCEPGSYQDKVKHREEKCKKCKCTNCTKDNTCNSSTEFIKINKCDPKTGKDTNDNSKDGSFRVVMYKLFKGTYFSNTWYY